MSKHEGQIFEDDVRRVARALWPSAAFDGSTIFADRERDGVFYGEFQINCIECTTDVTHKKAQIDLQKLKEIVSALRRNNPDTGVRGWFVTKQEPTAAQREAASSYRGIVTILSFDQFRSKLIDVSSYLSARERYPFGSVRSIEDDGPTVDRDEFVPIDLVDPTTDKLHSLRSITDRLTRQHARYVLEGDYGSGKSMTLRELFFQAVDNYKQGRTRQFPIFLNLRDHGGQTIPQKLSTGTGGGWE
jgi:hypothetical protein